VGGWSGSSASLVEGEVGSSSRVHKEEGDISFDVLRFWYQVEKKIRGFTY
jgi:hypothetical protein